MSAHLTNALLKHNQQVPRYTSYPTANHFSEAIGAGDAARWLTALPEGEQLSLYFHIPFCKKLCWYCGCHTKASEKYTPVAHYLSYLKKEIALVANKLGNKREVIHIHFGGGSPSYISADDFRDLMAVIRQYFLLLPEVEIAVEIDPRELTEVKVAAYRKTGVNRVSLGIQDFHIDVQQAINRQQPLHMIYDAVQLLRDYGINNINMDLLYGLPKQTSASIKENIKLALALDPSRIALFGYAHVPWMKKHMQMIDEASLPDSADRLDQFWAAASALKEKGYIQIGLDHFVKQNDPMASALKNGTLARNFQGYSTDSARVLIGFGSSAISDLPQGYTQNTLSNRAYFQAIDGNISATARGVKVKDEDQLIRRLIEKLMCYMQIDLKAFAAEENLSQDFFEPVLQKLQPFEADGLVDISGYVVSVNEDAPQAVRLVCAAFDPYLAIDTKKHAQVA